MAGILRRRTKHLIIKGIYFLYRFWQALTLPALLLYLLLRGLRRPAYFGSLRQRFGFLPHSYRQTGPGAIWLHAVSVGEVLTCLELARGLRATFPRAPLFVSSSTLAGYSTAQEKLASLAAGVFFAPLDYVFAVRRVLRALKPSLLLIAETEIWPNLIREARRAGAAAAIVNGRISDRAASRYFALAPFFRRVLPQLNLILAQNEEMRARFLRAGAPPSLVTVSGNLKFDFEARQAPPDSPPRLLLERAAPAAVWIAASTMPPATPGDIDEDDAVIAAYLELTARRRDIVLVLVPRKPERFDLAARKLDAAGIPYLRRSALTPDSALSLPGVLLLDSIGELGGLFALAHVVFMGGTLAARGGHNILEPAFFAKPIIIGPHMENFCEIAADFRRAGACLEISSPAELASAVQRALDDALALGGRALACAEVKRGATARAIACARRLYDTHLPRYRPAQPWRAMAGSLSLLWGLGGRLKRRRDLARRRRLPVPVVSIGNLSMGGTGKTPCVLLLASLLRDRGRRPGILTRGYGRHAPGRHLAVAPGATVHSEYCGDEPQIFVRAAIAPVGIGPRRFHTGSLLISEFATDILLLDDGFQHLRLHRDVDVVLVDALAPCPGGALFPLGRLREPLASLARADIFLITRSEFSETAPAIEHALTALNPRAPIFRASVAPLAWVKHDSGREYPLAAPPFHRAAAFCGIGNPQSFWRTLAALDIQPVETFEFGDHHPYRPQELRRMAAQAAQRQGEVLLTTQKDAINLCDGALSAIAPLRLYWLKVEMEIRGAAAFVAEIERRIGS
jgi:tetraacyldisaccharide 4'-kinase